MVSRYRGHSNCLVALLVYQLQSHPSQDWGYLLRNLRSYFGGLTEGENIHE